MLKSVLQNVLNQIALGIILKEKILKVTNAHFQVLAPGKLHDGQNVTLLKVYSKPIKIFSKVDRCDEPLSIKIYFSESTGFLGSFPIDRANIVDNLIDGVLLKHFLLFMATRIRLELVQRFLLSFFFLLRLFSQSCYP
jgi:hypothetical protein